MGFSQYLFYIDHLEIKMVLNLLKPYLIKVIDLISERSFDFNL